MSVGVTSNCGAQFDGGLLTVTIGRWPREIYGRVGHIGLTMDELQAVLAV
jgi:hypothetical protein